MRLDAFPNHGRQLPIALKNAGSCPVVLGTRLPSMLVPGLAGSVISAEEIRKALRELTYSLLILFLFIWLILFFVVSLEESFLLFSRDLGEEFLLGRQQRREFSFEGESLNLLLGIFVL